MEGHGSASDRKRQNLASLVDDWERHGEQIAAVTQRGLRTYRTSYGQLAVLTRRFAAELIRHEIVKGDRVLFWASNSAEWVAAFFGCLSRGVLPVPLDQTSPPDFAQRVQADVAPKLVLVDCGHAPWATEGAVPYLVLDHLSDSITTQTAEPLSDLGESDPLQIVFTSGTTGDPKGVVHTHRNVLASLAPIESEVKKYLKYERAFHPIRFLHTLPLSHVFGQFMGLWIPALLAAEVHFESRIVSGEIAARISAQRISVLVAVPLILDSLQGFLLSRFPDLETRLGRAARYGAWQRWWHFRDVHWFLGLKFWSFVCGGAALSPSIEQFWRSLGFVVVQGYGMTETTALISLNHPFRPAEGTIGQVLPGREVRLSEEGEVLVRGETIAKSTWQQGTLRSRENEWLATGDLAEFDDGGNLRFRGRRKDVIVTSSGLNIFPEDLEAALHRQPAVKSAAVIETRGDHGPEPLALLLMKDGDGQTALRTANSQLAEFQQIRRWMLWPEPDFPRTSTGKVLKRELARRIESGEISSGDADPTAGTEQNLDSLGRVELQAKLEQQFGVSISDTGMQSIRTESDVREAVKASEGIARNSPDAQIYPRWPWHPAAQAARAIFLELVAMPLVRLLAAPRVIATGEGWPGEPALIVCNHITTYDAALVLFALPGHMRRQTAIAMSGEMLIDMRRGRNQGSFVLNLLAPISYFLVTALFNVYPLPQRNGFRGSFRHAGEAMDRGYNVMVFPEGRRSDDGAPQPFKLGAGLLWKELGCPALPVHLSGLGELKARKQRWFRSGRIGIETGAVLRQDASRSPETLTDRLRRAVFENR